MFATKTLVSFDHDVTNGRTVMELVTGDRPGLLSTVGRIFIEFGINIENAKILTIGERAEDVFYVSDLDDKPLTDDTCKQLKERLVQAIDKNT